MKTILIAIPINKYIEPGTFKSIYDLIIPDGYRTEFQFFFGYQIDQIRNLISEWAKRYDYLFAVDSDIILPRDALKRLIEADKDIATGMYIQRIPGTQTLEVYGINDHGGMYNIPFSLLDKKGLVEVAACGFGCCLVKGEVFRKLPYPHFYYKSAINHKDTVSEDVYFCSKARQHGFRVWVDTDLRCDHIGGYTYSLETYEQRKLREIANQDLLPKKHIDYLQKMESEPKVIYDIGASVLHWTRHAISRWSDSKLFLFDATPEVEFLFRETGHEYHMGILTDQDNKQVKFYNDPFNISGNSYYKENTVHYNETHARDMTGMSLDTIVSQKGFPYPDMMKLDVQGAEMDVLNGATKCLENCQDVILEAQHANYNIGAPKSHDMIRVMESIGFTLVENFYRTDVDGDYHFKKMSD